MKTRRAFLRNSLIVLAAPAIVRSASLMPVKSVERFNLAWTVQDQMELEYRLAVIQDWPEERVRALLGPGPEPVVLRGLCGFRNSVTENATTIAYLQEPIVKAWGV